ncbi:MAG: DUF5658 family protein [Dehalococcoidia bacterium]|nr:DUF5658 family protein [Dehalococcoidia bacterium]
MLQRLDTSLRACLPYVVVAMVANLADSILTSVGIRLGFTEANPVASPLLSSTVCIFAKQMFVPVIAVLGGLLLTVTHYRIAAKACCLLLVTVAGLNLFTVIAGRCPVAQADTVHFTTLSWFVGVYASMVLALAIAWLHDHLTHNFLRKTQTGSLRLPNTRIESTSHASCEAPHRGLS